MRPRSSNQTDDQSVCRLGGALIPQLWLLLGSSANEAPAPAPLVPKWTPTYDLQRSLAAMPCNESGWSDAAEFAKIGIVTYDMNNAHDIWEATIPSSPEEVLEQQCAKTKAVSKDVKCGVYRNSAHM